MDYYDLSSTIEIDDDDLWVIQRLSNTPVTNKNGEMNAAARIFSRQANNWLVKNKWVPEWRNSMYS